MALIMQKCRFLHTPKTGGVWVRAAVRHAGVVFAEYHPPHVTFMGCPGQGMFTIAFVRHPWAWWKSYWVYKRSHSWDVTNPFDIKCMDNRFENFLCNVLNHAPGHCSRTFSTFTGRPSKEVDFIGRFENLVNDFVRALQMAGERFDEHKLRSTPPRNVGDYSCFSTKCSDEVRRRVLEAEASALTRFNYHPDEFRIPLTGEKPFPG
jgi:hypothetical protein